MGPRAIGGPARRDIWANVSLAVSLELDWPEASEQALSSGVYWHRARVIAWDGSSAATERTPLWESGICATAPESGSRNASARKNRVLCFMLTSSPLSRNVLAGTVLT